jgi:carbon starvation protein CstA
LLPMAFVSVATETAGYQLIRDQFYPKLILSGQPEKVFQGYLLSTLCVIAMGSLVFIFLDSVRRWTKPRTDAAAPIPQHA